MHRKQSLYEILASLLFAFFKKKLTPMTLSTRPVGASQTTGILHRNQIFVVTIPFCH